MDETLDSLIENLNLSSLPKKERVHDGKPVSIWLPLEYKAKYDHIQELTHQDFGRKLREIVKLSIDKVKIDERS